MAQARAQCQWKATTGLEVRQKRGPVVFATTGRAQLNEFWDVTMALANAGSWPAERARRPRWLRPKRAPASKGMGLEISLLVANAEFVQPF